MELTAREWADPSPPPFRVRLRAVMEEAVLIGVKWLIVSLMALFGVGWFLSDYAAIREQARYVAEVRLRQAQAQQAQAPAVAPVKPTPAPGGP